MKNWLPVLALGAVACSSSGTWRQVDTPHFTLKTDLSSSDAKHAGAALEATRDALVSAAWPHARFSESPTEVYVLANGLDFERYFGKITAGFFVNSSPQRFFLYGSPDRWEMRRSAHIANTSVLRHEMTHQLSAQVWPHQPQWFAEGLADFLEPIFYSDNDDKTVVLGGVNRNAWISYKSVRTIGIADALEWNKTLGTMKQREAAGLYGISWLFFHWMYNTHPEQLGKFIELMVGLSPPDEALKSALPDFDAATMDRTLHEYQKHGAFDEIPRPLVETPIVEADLKEHRLDGQEINDVKKVLADVSAMNLGKHRESSDGGDESSAQAATKRPIKPQSYYEALPNLPQYPCTKPGEATGDTKADGPAGESSQEGKKASKDSKKPTSTKEKPAATPAVGRLAPEVIQRLVRRSYDRFRTCYEDGLRGDPDLGGRISVRFKIELDGTVSSVAANCTSMPDPKVASCILEKFKSLKFPAPDGGFVTVTYPMMFSPGD